MSLFVCFVFNRRSGNATLRVLSGRTVDFASIYRNIDTQLFLFVRWYDFLIDTPIGLSIFALFCDL